MKPYLTLFACTFALLSTGTQLQAQEVTPGLECHYTGSWQSQGSKGTFSWHGFWFQGDGGWIFRGTGQDEFGKSHLKGACGYGECEWGQDYVSGSANGTGFSYKQTYKGDLGDSGPLKLNLSGDWSQGNSYHADENWQFTALGTYQAPAKCKALANIGDLEKKLGWPVWD